MDNKSNKIGLSIFALMLVFAPVFAYLLAYVFGGIVPAPLLAISLFGPIAGITVGIVSLCKGKKRIGSLGVVLSSIAVALPIIFVATILLAASTGAFIIGM